MSHQETPATQPGHRFQRRGFSYERAIKYFFASNAGLTIVILALIVIFLLKEGLGFFPGYRRELEIYRIAGLEFVDISRENLTAHEQLTSVLNRAYYAEINGLCDYQLQRSQEASAVYNSYSDKISGTRDLVLNNSQTEGNANPAMLESLKAHFQNSTSRRSPPFPRLPISLPQSAVIYWNPSALARSRRRKTHRSLPPSPRNLPQPSSARPRR